jgi:hypothetical protein
MLVVLGGYKEALVIFDKAKAVLVQHKEGIDYALLRSSMGFCYRNGARPLHATRKLLSHCASYMATATLNTRPRCSISPLCFFNLKQYEEAIPRLEEVLAIERRVFGDQHQITVDTAKALAEARQLAAQSHRGAIDVGHNFRMCSLCGAVSEMINTCPCVRAWYCNAECQLQHWLTHKPYCSVCFYCRTLLTKVMHCSRCKQASTATQHARRHTGEREHKRDCAAPTKQRKSKEASESLRQIAHRHATTGRNSRIRSGLQRLTADTRATSGGSSLTPKAKLIPASEMSHQRFIRLIQGERVHVFGLRAHPLLPLQSMRSLDKMA